MHLLRKMAVPDPLQTPSNGRETEQPSEKLT